MFTASASLARCHLPGGRAHLDPGAPASAEARLVFILEEVGKALQLSFFMFWEVLWPLALGFLLSAVVQTVVSKRAVAGALGKDDARGFALALGFGAASSSCSYAAVSVGRALFRRGASFANAIISELASTNLLFALRLVLLVLLRWQLVGGCFARARPTRGSLD